MLRVLDEQGEQLGVMTRADALRAAREAELDLVEVSPNAAPPVAKIVDWGKYNYQRTKQIQKAKKNNKTLDVKQIRLGLKISDHDMGVKMRHAGEFLVEGHSVKLAVVFRGRELAHKELGKGVWERAIAMIEEQGVVDSQPAFAGKQMIGLIRSKGNAKN